MGERLADYAPHADIRLGILREVWAVVRRRKLTL
jgi:hypothetical protein